MDRIQLDLKVFSSYTQFHEKCHYLFKTAWVC